MAQPGDMMRSGKDSSSLGQRFLAHRSAPVALAMTANVAFVFMDSSVQVLQTRGMPASEVFTGRMWLNTVITTAYYLVYDRQAFRRIFKPSRNTRLLWLRGLSGALSLAFIYQALGLLATADCMTIVNTRPLLVALIGWYWLAEAVSRIQIIASVISFSAVLLVIQPEFLFHHTTFSPIGEDIPWGKAIGLGCTLGCLVSNTFDLLICRVLNGAFDAGEMLLVYNLIGSICGPILIVITGGGIVVDTRPLSWAILLGITVCGIGAQLSVTMALARTKATNVAILGYFQIVFASAVQVVLWSVPPNLFEVIGMAIIIAAGIWSILYGTTPEKPAESEMELPLLARGEDMDGPMSDLESGSLTPMRTSARTQGEV